MLHRLIDSNHCNVAPILYQVSIFDLFMRISTDQAISADKDYNELRNFIKKGVFKRMCAMDLNIIVFHFLRVCLWHHPLYFALLSLKFWRFVYNCQFLSFSRLATITYHSISRACINWFQLANGGFVLEAVIGPWWSHCRSAIVTKFWRISSIYLGQSGRAGSAASPWNGLQKVKFTRLCMHAYLISNHRALYEWNYTYRNIAIN